MGRHKKVTLKNTFAFKPSLKSTLPTLCILFVILSFLVRTHNPNRADNFSDVEAQVVANPTLAQTFEDTVTSPGQNRPPILTTRNLPVGTVGSLYKTTVSSWDNDTSDSLSFSISGLPENLLYECDSKVNKNIKKMNCLISGTPTYAFTSDSIIVTVIDNRGGSVTNTYNLTIVQPTPTVTPTVTPTPINYVSPSPAYVLPTWTPTR